MSARPVILARLASLHMPAPAPRRDHLAEQAAAGIAHYLGLSDQQAALLARDACARRLARRSGAQLQPARALEALRQALESGSCLLALPFSGSGLDLLHALAADASLPLLLVESPAIAGLEADLGPTANGLPRCHASDAIKHVKGPGKERSLVYISFPELHALGAGTTTVASLLGKPCRWSVLEPLLCMVGLGRLLTLDAAAPASDADPALVGCDIPASALLRTEQVATLLRWLLGHLEMSASLAPADTFSWHPLYRASMHCYQIERDNGIKQLDAYLKAWRASPAGLPEPAYRLAMTRIAALRDTGAVPPRSQA